MIRKMVPRVGVALTAALILSACGGGSNAANPNPDAASNNATALDYSYPLNQQTQVPTPAPVVLDFSNSISGTDVAGSISLHQVDGSGKIESGDVAVTTKTANNGKALILTPTDKLAPHTTYAVVINGSRVVKDRDITFTTRAAQQGPESEQVSSDTMQLTSLFPNGSTDEPMMDFSTLRLDFSQPLDRSTVSYGNGPNDTVALVDGNDNVVPAHVLVDGPYLTIDPDKNLTPGEHYTLRFVSNAVKSTFGKPFYYTDQGKWHFTPKSSLAKGLSESQRPKPLVQKITESGKSPLIGADVNLIPMNATLLGDNNNIQQSGNVLGDLAYLPDYPNVSPLSIRRGTLLKGASIKVNIGGKVYAGFDTGEVDVRFLTDASGYLIPNPYDSSPNAPKLVKLEMDVAISAANSTANAGVTQNITHLELIGTAQTDTKKGVININAVGVVTPEILGLERGYGTLSFQLQTYPDQTSAPTVAKDTTPPTLQSWMPGDNADLQSPDEPIILNFSEPLDKSSLKQPGALSLTKDGANVNFSYRLDGASLVIQPEGGLHYSPASSNPEYTLQIGSQVTDLAGNQFVPKTLTFKLPDLVETKNVADDSTGVYSQEPVQVNSPVLLSAYPGYPCVTDPSSRDLANGYVGRCAGGTQDWADDKVDSTGEPYIDSYQEDDNLPLMSMPADDPIVLQFTKEIDPASVRLGDSFKVQSISADETNAVEVPGRVEVQGRVIKFYPKYPWKEDQIYRYTLSSNGVTDPASNPNYAASGYIGSPQAVCDGTGSICGKDGFPLQTQPLGVLSRTNLITNANNFGGRVVASYSVKDNPFLPNAGGPDLEIFFKGMKQNSNVVQTLESMPSADTNGNFIHETDAVGSQLTTLAALIPPFYATAAASYYQGHSYPATYNYQEPSPNANALDPNANQQLDPGGVIGLKNSVKILSLNTNGSDSPWSFTDTSSIFKMAAGAVFGVDGGNVGCGYDSVYDLSTGQQIPPPQNPAGVVGSNPTVCPTKKFTYVKMDLNASVTNQYVDGKGIKVLIWPSAAMSTSITLYARNPELGAPTLAIPTGDQIMRMRYAKDENGNRTQPITGWITTGPNGKPVLNADVDLYLDAPILDSMIGALTLRHTLHSYKISMNLTGPIRFLGDGRMMINQNNTNVIRIDQKQYSAQGGIATGEVSLEIPKGGVSLQLISSPIKSIK